MIRDRDQYIAEFVKQFPPLTWADAGIGASGPPPWIITEQARRREAATEAWDYLCAASVLGSGMQQRDFMVTDRFLVAL